MTDLNDLPRSMRYLAESLEKDVRLAIKVMIHFGGQEIKFPKVPPDDHPAVLALGKDDALRLCKYLSGGLIYVPHARPPKSARQDVLRLQSEGRDRAVIARTLGISQRHVRRVANKTPDNQPSLFDDLD